MYVINLVSRVPSLPVLPLWLQGTGRGETLGMRFACYAYTDMGLGVRVIKTIQYVTFFYFFYFRQMRIYKIYRLLIGLVVEMIVRFTLPTKTKILSHLHQGKED